MRKVLERIKNWLSWKYKFWRATRVSLKRVTLKPVYGKSGRRIGWTFRGEPAKDEESSIPFWEE